MYSYYIGSAANTCPNFDSGFSLISGSTEFAGIPYNFDILVLEMILKFWMQEAPALTQDFKYQVILSYRPVCTCHKGNNHWLLILHCVL